MTTARSRASVPAPHICASFCATRSGRGLTRFDFTIGDEPYKRDWCDTEQQLFDYSAATTVRGLPAAAMTFGWGRAKRAIKQTAPVWNAVQRLRATAGSLRKKPEAAAKDAD